MRRHVYLHSEDLDGWLAPPNGPLIPACGAFLAGLEGLSVLRGGELHELRIVLNSGKAPAYLLTQAELYGGEYIIACNGAAWQRRGDPVRLFGPPNPAFARLRSLLGLPPCAVGVAELRWSGCRAAVAIEEGKQADGGDVVLTLFPEAMHGRSRWSFTTGVDRYTLCNYLRSLIRDHSLALEVLEPHRDGGLDVVSKVEGRAVAKWTLPRLATEMFSGSVLHLAHGGDASNDLPALQAEGVTPLTASNCKDTVDAVRARGGVVTVRSAPRDGALFEAYRELAIRGWYGPLSDQVLDRAERFLTLRK